MVITKVTSCTGAQCYGWREPTDPGETVVNTRFCLRPVDSLSTVKDQPLIPLNT